MSKKIIKDVEVTTIGSVSDCHHCRKADSEAPGYVYIAKGKYEYIDLRDDKAKSEIKRAAKIMKKPVEKLDSIPIVIIKRTECDENACQTKEKVVVGYDRSEFKKEIGL